MPGGGTPVALAISMRFSASFIAHVYIESCGWGAGVSAPGKPLWTVSREPHRGDTQLPCAATDVWQPSDRGRTGAGASRAPR